jgi:hypothetical protein
MSTLRMTSAGSPATSIGEVRMMRPYGRALTVSLTRSRPAAPTPALPVAVVHPFAAMLAAQGCEGARPTTLFQGVDAGPQRLTLARRSA